MAIIIWSWKHFEGFLFKTRRNSFSNFDIIFFFMIVVFSKWWWWLSMLEFELFELLQIDFNAVIAIVNNLILWLIDDVLKTVRFEVFYCWDNKLFKRSKMMFKCEIYMIQLRFNACNDLWKTKKIVCIKQYWKSKKSLLFIKNDVNE